MGHPSHKDSPALSSTDDREIKKASAEAEEFFDDIGVNSHERNSEQDREPEGSAPPAAVPTPDEAAAIEEMARLKMALAEASSYGAGTNAAGKLARRRPDSARI